MVLSCLLVAICNDIARGQFHETYDSANTSWELSLFDGVGPEKTWLQQRIQEPDSTNRVEQIYFQTGYSTKILASQDIPPSFVISELRASLRIKSTRPGPTLLVRVVLPHTASPDGKGVLKTTLAGPSCSQANRWQTLSFDASEITQLLNEELWVLRKKYGTQVSIKNAFIDKLILNLYSGVGEHDVLVDDARVHGIVSADGIGKQTQYGPIKLAAQRLQPLPPKEPKKLNGDQRAKALTPLSNPPIFDPQIRLASNQTDIYEKQPSHVKRDGSVLEVNGTPFFPRIIQHNGESFAFLKSLGFNTIELRTTATSEQLASAEQEDMWIICPAPAFVGVSPIGFEYDRVLAWNVGKNLSLKRLEDSATSCSRGPQFGHA